jgi:hypothetical protein
MRRPPRLKSSRPSRLGGYERARRASGLALRADVHVGAAPGLDDKELPGFIDWFLAGRLTGKPPGGPGSFPDATTRSQRPAPRVPLREEVPGLRVWSLRRRRDVPTGRVSA